MTVKRSAERRSEHRLSFQGNIPGRLQHKKGELEFAPFDISKKGLGLYLNPCPKEGEEVSLVLKGGEGETNALRFTIKHIYDHSERQGMKRCGIELKTNVPGIDLIELLSRYL
ncbi:MAG: PilZ domain-containing protein [Bdellovibrionota bacterium]